MKIITEPEAIANGLVPDYKAFIDQRPDYFSRLVSERATNLRLAHMESYLPDGYREEWIKRTQAAPDWEEFCAWKKQAWKLFTQENDRLVRDCQISLIP